MPQYIRFLVLILLSTQFGCTTVSYYSQSVSGQMQILFNREPIAEVVNDPETPDTLRDKLNHVRDIRKFSVTHLNLPENDSYLYYVDLERDYVVWNVFAAPEFSLTPKNWCYPIVGCVSYRGYFDKKDALLKADSLKQNGLDVSVSGIAAYSTLGWFDDPVLNTMIKWNTRMIASLLFHELSHQVLYFSGDTAFNEAFSTSVERIGTILWLKKYYPEKLDRYLDTIAAYDDFRNLLENTRRKLLDLYDSNLTADQKRQGKNLIFSQLHENYEEKKMDWESGVHFDSWFKKPVNNARFTSTLTYLQYVPAFYAIYLKNDLNLTAFYEEVKGMESLSKEERKTVIEELLEEEVTIEKIKTLH